MVDSFRLPFSSVQVRAIHDLFDGPVLRGKLKASDSICGKIKTGMANKSPILGRWRIIEMETWEQDYVDEEVQAFIRYDPDGLGEFQFAYVSGNIDHRLGERDGKPAVEWSWEGTETAGGMDQISGRGWAVLDEDGKLRGRIFIHDGDDSGFVARKKREGLPKKINRRRGGR